MLVVGATLLTVALDGRAFSRAEGGTLRVVSADAIVFLDPTVARRRLEWQLGSATGVRLLTHPDVSGPRGWELVPEGAVGFPRVSRDGKVYTFTIRRGFRFSNGKPVRAAHYAYALNRSLQPDIDFPGAPYLADADGVDIVGAFAVAMSKRKTAAGIRARGNELIITLNRPSAELPAVLALPIFQAIPLGLPRDRVAIGGHGLVSAGPYHVASADLDRQSLTLRRNPYYRRKRVHRPAEIQVDWGLSPEAAYAAVDSGAADYSVDLPSGAHAELADRYGITSGRYRVNPGSCLHFLWLSRESGMFRNNPSLRRALSFLIDRHAMADAYTAVFGAYALSLTDQYIPRGFPGFADVRLYPLDAPSVARAQQLAAGRTRSGTVVYPRVFDSPLRELLEINRADLAKIGIRLESQTGRFRRVRANVVPAVSCARSLRPEFLLDVFGGELPARYARRLARTSGLGRVARTRAIARLDATIAGTDAPGVAWASSNDREFFSERVDPQSIVYQPSYGGADLMRLRLR